MQLKINVLCKSQRHSKDQQNSSPRVHKTHNNKCPVSREANHKSQEVWRCKSSSASFYNGDLSLCPKSALS